MRAALVRVAGVLVVFASLQAQVPQPAPAPPPPGTALLLGRVLEGSTTQPVAGALVTLSGAGGSSSKVIADAEGRFLFTQLPGGEFIIRVAKAGYLNGLSGQRVPRGPGRPIVIAEGDRIGDAVVRLWRFAAVAGTILDDTGEPAVGVEVRLVERVLAGGERVLAQVPNLTATTDDRGIYRFSAVAPGEYVLFARSPADFAPRVLLSFAASDQSAIAAVAARASRAATSGHIEDLVDIDAAIRVYPPTFYPAAATPAEAEVIGVRAGEQRNGVDLHMAPVPIGRVAGTLLHDGDPVPQARVRVTLPGLPIDVASATSGADGRFSILGVAGGSYVLRATREPRTANAGARGRGGARGGQPALPADPTFWATHAIVAGTPEAASLTLAMHAGARIRGRIEFAGATRPSPEEVLQFQLAVQAPGPPAANSVGRIEADGAFQTAGLLPGRYRLRLTGQRPWRAAAALSDGVDLLDTPIDVSDTDRDQVVITMTDAPAASLGGTIRTRRGAPDLDAVVLVLPADPRLAGERRMRILRTTSSGAYDAADLPAGDYVVALTTDDEVRIGFDREAIARLTQTGTRVTLHDGDRRTVDLQSESTR